MLEEEKNSFCLHYSADWFPAPAQSRQSAGRFNVELSDAEAAVAIRVALMSAEAAQTQR